MKYLSKSNFKLNTNLVTNNIKPNNHDQFYEKKELYEMIPTVILITHHKDIFQKNLIEENYLIRFFTMESIVQSGDCYYSFLKDPSKADKRNPNHKYLSMMDGLKLTNLEEQDKIIFMYKVKPGFSVNSFSIFCAKQIGFDKDLLLRMNEVQNTARDKITANPYVLKKYEDTIRDLLFRINDFLCSIKVDE